MLKHFGKIISVVVLLGAVVATALVGSTRIAQAQGPTAKVHYYYTQALQLQHTAPEASKLLLYHGGPVMLKSTTYAIYWEPSGHSIDGGYKTLLERYFNDIGGSHLYNTLTQYYQTSPTKHIKNNSTFGGSWSDTTAFPHAGTYGDPLTDKNIRDAVKRAIAANSWPTGLTNYYFVFTGPNVESCADATHCTPGTAHPVFCAYHGNFKSNNHDVIYSNMPYDGSYGAGCTPFSTSPNGNLAADGEISTLSHEHIEGVADPKVSTGPYAWYDAKGNEMADKCGYKYGTIEIDGHNVILNGNEYIVQEEWSNAAKGGNGGCVKGIPNP